MAPPMSPSFSSAIPRRKWASAKRGSVATACRNAATASATRPTSRQARPRSCWMTALDGCSSDASRKGAIASAGRPARSSSVANASKGAAGCGWDRFGDWSMGRGWRRNCSAPISDLFAPAWRLYQMNPDGHDVHQYEPASDFTFCRRKKCRSANWDAAIWKCRQEDYGARSPVSGTSAAAGGPLSGQAWAWQRRASSPSFRDEVQPERADPQPMSVLEAFDQALAARLFLAATP